VNGFFEAGTAGTVATWVAAVVTLGVWSYLAGERRLLHVAQLLLAGLATGYLALIAIREVLVPQLLTPLLANPAAHPDLLLDLVLVGILALAPWLPRRAVALPAAVLVGGTAAYALSGAIIGTMLPQLRLRTRRCPVRPAGPGDHGPGAPGLPARCSAGPGDGQRRGDRTLVPAWRPGGVAWLPHRQPPGAPG
jgi:hypothetical protein